MKFGTSGLRGLSVELLGPPSILYATAFGRYLLQAGSVRPGDSILVGRDFRASSPQIASNCAVALESLGFEVVDCGTVPTPALALYGFTRGVAALMVTGSHIPADRNGIKFYRPDGEINKIDEFAITALANAIEKEGYPCTDGLRSVKQGFQDCVRLFYERNIGLLPDRALTGLRIGVYQHSTVARDLLVDVLAHYGADIETLGRSEEFVPVDTEAVSDEAISRLKEWAFSLRLDAIVSADGDGDRPLISDENGTPLRGDLLGLIASEFTRATAVVTPVTSNSGIEASGRFNVRRTRVGSPFVIAAMDEIALNNDDARVVGFEANGGFLTATAIKVNGNNIAALPTRDSFLPILAALSLLKEKRQPMSEIVKSFHLPVAASDRIEDFSVAASAALMESIRDRKGLEDFLSPIGQPSWTSDIDGLRVGLEDNRIIHFRPSGNAPEIRCYVEAQTLSDAEALLLAGLHRIKQWAKRSYPNVRTSRK
jgi:phosphomannomutase